MMVLRSRRRLVGLFLAAVLLPCALLVLLTVRGIRQERELAEKRAADEQARIFAQVRRMRHARRDRISSQALSARSAVPRSIAYEVWIMENFLPKTEAPKQNRQR